jgi:hypothetical protein
VWGVLTWRGVTEQRLARGAQLAPRVRQINGAHKRVWRYMPSEGDAARMKQLALEWRRHIARERAHSEAQQQQRQQQEQQAAEGGGS